MNKNTSVSPVGQGQTPNSTKVPSLKNKVINRNGKNFNHDSRASRAMHLSSPLKMVSRPHSSALAPRQYAVAHDKATPFPSLLRSPFKPAKRRSIHKKVAQAAADSMFRRPSDGLATRRARLLDSRRHPSDSSASKRQNIYNPFLKDLEPFPQPRRQASFFDDLQKPTPATPKTPSLYKSPSINAGFSGPIPEPIPHVPALLDTPINDTDQLIADLSEFSLAPKPCSLQLTPPSIVPALDDGPASMQLGDSTPVGTTQSSPGISIPSIDDSWFVAKEGSHSTPVKGPLSSDDELNLFLPIHSSTLAVSRRRSSKPANGPVQRRTQFQPLKRTYGKKMSRKSVAFAPSLTGSTNGDPFLYSLHAIGNCKYH